MREFDYEELGLVAGLEIHQQLDTEQKLFCACPTELREPEDSDRQFTRYLHPTKSELGEIDEAALEESTVDREFEYLAFDSTCLVEADDEPPSTLDDEALETTLEIADLLDMTVLDQVHVMRKIVVDGSNTTGFQRTAAVADGGAIETEEGVVRIDDLMLEEESAQRIEETDDGVRYSLDRLGIPLVEIGTEPDITSPEQARAAAERIGMCLRSTGKVKRGLGTIRQDVNVSVADGARVELKGVQSLDDIDDIVRNEVRRQVRLLEVAQDLRERDADVGEPIDVTEVFAGTDSSVIQSALEPGEPGVDEDVEHADPDADGAGAGGEVWAVRLVGFDGLVGAELQPDRRLGTELSDHAKRHGAGGIFHTDELPAYGITDAEVDALREAVGTEPDDAVAIVAADAETARLAIEAAADRAATAVEGVPEETRDANEDGTSRYLRPLPGAARMYPETDVPPVEPDPSDVEPPELLDEKAERYAAEHDLDPDLADQVASDERMPLFEAAVEDDGVDATLAATTLTATLTELRRDDVPVERITDEHLRDALGLVDAGEVPNEGLEDLLTALAEDPSLTAEAAVEARDLGGVSEDEVREAVVEVVERNVDQVEAEGMGAFSALMGECMGVLRGKADGDVVSDVLREEVQRRA